MKLHVLNMTSEYETFDNLESFKFLTVTTNMNVAYKNWEYEWNENIVYDIVRFNASHNGFNRVCSFFHNEVNIYSRFFLWSLRDIHLFL